MATRSSTTPGSQKAALRTAEAQTEPAKRSSADVYYRSATLWNEELTCLRRILRQSGLTETVKWGAPCYTHKDNNVVGVGAFKRYFGLWFYQGALLVDSAGVLINAQQHHSLPHPGDQSTLQPAIIHRYIAEAIGNIDSGRAIKAERNRTLDIPNELASALRRTKGATAAFRALTPGRQREYAAYISEARREATRQARIEKVLPMIKRREGLNDRYR